MQLKNIHTIYIPTSSFKAFYFQKKNSFNASFELCHYLWEERKKKVQRHNVCLHCLTTPVRVI